MMDHIPFFSGVCSGDMQGVVAYDCASDDDGSSGEEEFEGDNCEVAEVNHKSITLNDK